MRILGPRLLPSIRIAEHLSLSLTVAHHRSPSLTVAHRRFAPFPRQPQILKTFTKSALRTPNPRNASQITSTRLRSSRLSSKSAPRSSNPGNMPQHQHRKPQLLQSFFKSSSPGPQILHTFLKISPPILKSSKHASTSAPMPQILEELLNTRSTSPNILNTVLRISSPSAKSSKQSSKSSPGAPSL